MRDNNNTNVAIGDLVAYNRSGDIVLGVVEKFQQARGKRQWWYCTIYVRNSRDQKLSKVKRPQSLMVLGAAMVTAIQRSLFDKTFAPF